VTAREGRQVAVAAPDPDDSSAASPPVTFDAQPDPAMVGAIDLHVHGYPDVGLRWRMRTDDLTLVRLARAYGMAGIVLKSHFWPTMDRALLLNELLGAEDFEIYSSITLNQLVGGISPMAVEAAAAHGARVVFLSTWGSANDHAHGGVVRRQVIDPMFPSFSGHLDRAAIRVVDGNGRLSAECRDVLAVASDLGLTVSTGHLSTGESLAVARHAAEIGFGKLIFAHPFSPSIRAERSLMGEIADLGVTVEMTHALTVLPRAPITVGDIHAAIGELGCERVVLTSDVFFDWLPPHAEVFRMFLGQLRSLGCSTEELRTMVVDNPVHLLSR
jgi:hypothetical protein